MKRLFPLVAVAVILQSAGLAHAADEAYEPTPGQVRTAAEAFDRGREAYKAEEYVEAAEQFESAYANAPSAAALELAMRARDKAGQLDRAATLAALGLARNGGDAGIQKVAPGLVERAKSELFELNLKCDDPCDVTVGGKLAPGRRTTERTLFVPDGTYVVRAGWSGDRSASKSVEASKGASGTLEFEAPSEPEAAPRASPVRAPVSENAADEGGASPSAGLPPTVFWVGVGLTAVSTGISIWSGIDTQNNPGTDKVRAACQGNSSDCQTLYQQGVDKQHRTNALFGVTAGLGVATAIVGVLFTDWGGSAKAVQPPASEQARLAHRGFYVEPWLSIGSGASVGALGRF